MILRLIAVGAALLFLFAEAWLGPTAPFVKAIPVAVLSVMILRAAPGPGKTLAGVGMAMGAVADAAIEYRFILGLVAFLVTHLFYIAAFTKVEKHFRWARLAPVVLWAALVLPVIATAAGELRVPVVIYGVVIFIMIWRAGAAVLVVGRNAGTLGFLGALLFGVSDTLLGYSRFVATLPGASFLVLGTYWVAQALIAASFGAFRKDDAIRGARAAQTPN